MLRSRIFTGTGNLLKDALKTKANTKRRDS